MLSLDDADRSAIYADEHHELVKGPSIVAPRIPVEVLEPGFRRKISRYVRFWQDRYGSGWPAFTKPEDDVTKAKLPERTIDQILFSAYRCRDNLVLFAYSYLPLSLLKKYRDDRRAKWLKVTRQE
jgi:hypothetical protein